MTLYELLLPLGTILFGIFVILALDMFTNENEKKLLWLLQSAVLGVATFQQFTIYRISPTIYVRGGMVLDGLSQILSMSILALALLIHFNRRNLKTSLWMQSNVLFLGMTFFALIAVQANRLFFGILAIVCLIWSAQGAFAVEHKAREQTVLIHSGFIRGLIFLLVGTLLCFFCFMQFGETQIDEIQRLIVRPHMRDSIVYAIEILILFIGSLTLGIPPFTGILGEGRQGRSSWSLAIGATGLFAVVGIGIFLRWGIMVFSRSGVGRYELEALTSFDVFLMVRIIAMVGLVLVPLLALLNQNLRQSILLFILNPFVQSLFALSFGQREVLGFSIAQIFLSALTLGLLAFSIRALSLPEQAHLVQWVGIGRRALIPTLIFLLCLSALAGISPFFGSIVLQKTLSIKTVYGFVLLVNVALGGFYVVRMAEIAFQRINEERISYISLLSMPLSRVQKIWFISQFVLLIFMGIFWQPLYKYGAYSVRGFFGDL